MVSHLREGRTGTKEFRLVKFFAYASFIVLAIFSFPFSVVISQNTRETLLNSYKKSALLVGENLNHQVFQKFVIPVTRRYGHIKLREPEQYSLMDEVVKNTIHGFNIELVNLCGISQGVIAYSTDPKLIGQKVKEDEGYLKAVNGESYSGLVTDTADLLGLDVAHIGKARKLRSYLPLRGSNPYIGTETYVAGVIELTQDLSEEYRSIVRFQYLVFGLSILIMGLIFVALLLIVHKAERVIEQRAKERRELEEQLRQAEHMASLGEMVAVVSHEIKNPLGIIQSTAELLSSMKDEDGTRQKLSGVINEESARLNRIVTEFLDFARPQIPNLQECRLEDIARKNLLFLKPELEQKGIKVTHNLDERSFPLLADQDLLYRAFLNIFINAIQSMEGGGSLSVKVEEDLLSYLVEISDTGSGVHPDNLKRVFNPFFTTKQKGSGLGLPIVRKIVEAHKGVISIDTKKSQGTNVSMRLPKKG